ncbi:MAG: nitroreductase family protein [Deltaproteobacteria bacterium]|nr:nitroreductase family protein [Deltaproteobacteria bacterium]MBW2696865.1 nitroreductase family protein [Deltaproteobacteria bacterium]
MLELTPDELLTTTRSVRRRLDFERPVERELIQECLEIAFQAPNGSNLNTWQWVVVDEPELVARAAALYNAGLDDYIASLGEKTGESYIGAQVPRSEHIATSVQRLRDDMHRCPALLLPLMAGRVEGMSVFWQASQYGSIIQAVWSFFLALRARGLGSAWTTGHLWREQEMGDLLGVSVEHYTQIGLFPIAYTLGTDFKAAHRKPAAEVVSWNRFGDR